MFAAFILLFLVSLLAMIIGVIKPSVFNRIFKDSISRKKLFFIFGGATLIFFIVAIATTPKDLSKQSDTVKQGNNVVADQSQNKPIEPQAETKSEAVVETKEEVVPETIEQKITKVINESLGDKTNTDKPRVVEVLLRQYNTAELKEYNYKLSDKVFNIFIKINASDNLTTNLLKGAMHDEAAKVFQAVFSLQSDIADITLWSQLPVKDQYGNEKDDVAIVYGMARPLYDKMNWNNFNHRNLPDLLKSEGRTDDRNSYFEKVRF